MYYIFVLFSVDSPDFIGLGGRGWGLIKLCSIEPPVFCVSPPQILGRRDRLFWRAHNLPGPLAVHAWSVTDSSPGRQGMFVFDLPILTCCVSLCAGSPPSLWILDLWLLQLELELLMEELLEEERQGGGGRVFSGTYFSQKR